MRIYSFLEWAEQSILEKAICTLDYRHCLPNANDENCIECYEGYVKKCLPKICKEV